MTALLGISGSLRRDSYNTALLRTAATMMPRDTKFEIATLEDIPLYDADIEERGIPEPVERLKSRMRSADGLLIATPEYNNSLPGVLKNAIDWASRPPADSAEVFAQRPVAVIGVTPGRYGTILAQNAWLSVARTLSMLPWQGGRLMVSGAGEKFDDRGNLTDSDTQEALRDFLAGFVTFVNARR